MTDLLEVHNKQPTWSEGKMYYSLVPEAKPQRGISSGDKLSHFWERKKLRDRCVLASVSKLNLPVVQRQLNQETVKYHQTLFIF